MIEENEAPDSNEEYLLYQTLLGSWPLQPFREMSDEARNYAQAILTPPKPAKGNAPETLERFRELVERANGTPDARALVRELKAVGGNLKALRIALTGQERGPELWAVIAALPRDEALRRIDAAL